MCQICYEAVEVVNASAVSATGAITYTASARCSEHNMPMAGVVSPTDLCAIGKIEAATETALEKIRAAAQAAGS